jgi:hypothetical protein
MTDHDSELVPAPVPQSLSAEDRAWLRDFVARFLATNRHEHPRTAIDLGLGALHALRGR